jgi:HlyD family secretion protein
MTQPSSKPQLELVKPSVGDQPTPAVKAIPPKKSWSMWQLLSILVATIAILTVGWIYGVPLALGPVVIPVPVIRADLVQSLVASGHVETPFRITVSSQISGIVKTIPVTVGDKVKAGDALVELDGSAAEASVAQAQGVLAQAIARVSQQQKLTLPAAIQSLAQVKATLANVQEIYTRTSTLASKGILAKAALQQAEANLGIARAQVTSAELQVASNQEGGSDFTMVATQQAQAQAALAVAQAHLETFVVKAARDGILISKTVEVGNVIQPGTELMQLSPDGKIEILVQVDEKNLGLVVLGQPALISADAYSKETFPALVTFIDPAVDLARAAVAVKLSVENPPSYLRQDMTVSVDIEVNRRPKTLIVNVVDLHELKNDTAWMLKIVNGTATRQHVNVGLVSSGKAEILVGLVETDQIIPASASTVTDGKRIRIGTAPVVNK